MDLLFEFEYVPRKEVGIRGGELRDQTTAELACLPAVARALTDGDRQLERYRKELEQRHGDALQLHAFTVVAVGSERLVGRELTPAASG